MNAISRCPWLVGFLLLIPAAAVYSEESFTDTVETAFVDGGKISITLSAGEHAIARSEDNHIRISWTVEDRDKDDVETKTKVDGSKAKVDIDGPKEDFRTVIEVPKHSDLVVRLSAGELHVGNIDGSKDIRVRAGELSIEVGAIEDYAEVKGSLWAGDIDAGPFSMEKSGLFRSIEWEGSGDHSIKFKLYAGEVRLLQAQD